VLPNHQNLIDSDTPNNLVKEFYRKHIAGNVDVENDFYFESFEHGETNIHNNR
jgi:hypothetical protein